MPGANSMRNPLGSKAWQIRCDLPLGQPTVRLLKIAEADVAHVVERHGL